MFHKKLRMLSYQEVSITDEYLNHSLKLELSYLLSLEADRLLAGFRETAGKKPKAIRYRGWESTEIQGHTMGHYLTALAQAWGMTRNSEIGQRMDQILLELDACQQEDGFLFASPKALFDKVEKKEPVWVPWYTMHKLVSGLTAVCVHTQNKKAEKILEGLADWITDRVLSWSVDVKNTVLAVEYGGMNDCLYEVYQITGKERHALAAHQFDELPLFTAMAENRDILNGLHANTTIPKILGGLKRYAVLEEKDPFYLDMAKNFWEMVVSHHTYITGGNSEWEHFGEPDILNGERTACNCETCNTYNMIKLSNLLYSLTGEKKYADFDEQAYINTILSSQHHETGMTTYFQPMETGFFKVYSTPYDKFWCCTGTGMENFTKQCEGICYSGKNTLYINRFISAEVQWKEKQAVFEIHANLLKEESVRIRLKKYEAKKYQVKTEEMKIAVRIPDWIEGEPETAISGSIQCKKETGYLIFGGNWKPEDEITITFPMEIRVHSLPDGKAAAAFSYGPFVLSADLGKEDLGTTVTGVDVTVPVKNILVPEYLLLEKEEGEDGLDRIKKRFRKQQDELKFFLKSADGTEFCFAPHFLKNQVRYGIYFYIFEEGSAGLQEYQKEQSRKNKVFMKQCEVIPLGNDQYELAHRVQGYRTNAVNQDGKRGRSARPDGWFSYEISIPKQPCALHLTLRGQEGAGEFQIRLNDEVWIQDCTQQCQHFYEAYYNLPPKYRGQKVRIKFQNQDREKTFRIFDELFLSTEQ